MRITWQTVKTLPVVTKSGIALGRVCDLTLDIETAGIVCFHVKRSRLGGDILLINHSQIVAITKKEILVDDTILSEEKKKSVRVNRIPDAPALLRNEQEGV